MLQRILQDQHIFPKIILVLYAGSCVRYGFAGNWWRALYWFAAALITISVTFAPSPK